MIVKKVVRYLWVLIPHLIIAQSEVQVISLQECFQQAMNNHPIADRPALIEKVESVRQLQVTRSRYPDIFWNSNIVLQSAVPDLDLNFPESVGDPIDLPLYNFQSYLEAAYTVYDAGLTQLKSKEAELMMTVDNQRVTVDLEKLKSETAKYFYGVLLMRKRVQILLKSVESLSSQKDRLAAALEYGTALKSDVAQLDVEIAETRGRIADIQRSGKKFLRLLEGLTGTSFPDSVKLEVPNFDVPPSDQLGRAELLLFEYEKELSNHRSGYLEASLRPTVSVFSRAGFGYPNPLNFFQDELSPYGLIGLRMHWNIFNWHKSKADREEIRLQGLVIENKERVFRHEIERLTARYTEEQQKLEELIGLDEEILELQTVVISSFEAQLDEGVITTTEFITQLNRKTQTELRLETRKIELEQIQTNFLIFKGLL